MHICRYVQSTDLQSAYVQCIYVQFTDLQTAYIPCRYVQSTDLQSAYIQCRYVQSADLQSAYYSHIFIYVYSIYTVCRPDETFHHVLEENGTQYCLKTKGTFYINFNICNYSFLKIGINIDM